MDQSTNPTAAGSSQTASLLKNDHHLIIQNMLSTLREPRNIVQSLTTKFQAAADVAAMSRIDETFERIMNYRQENLSKSKANLNRIISFLFVTNFRMAKES